MSKLKDECAILNDHIFGKYHEQQRKVLSQIQSFSKNSIQKKQEKSSRLKAFVQEQTQDSEQKETSV